MHVGSQWFAMPRHVAGSSFDSNITAFLEWFLRDPLPISYQEYASHVVVADEHYFSTLFSHSPYCRDLVGSLYPSLDIL